MLAIGTATQDVFLSGEALQPHRHGKELFEELKLGSKLTLDAIVFATGGNAMNAAVTFARQGLHSSFMGVIGDDPAGQAVTRVLDDEDIDTTYLHVADDQTTSYSTILLAPTGERTILNYSGAKIGHGKHTVDMHALDGDWLYISSMGGSMQLLADVVDAAAKKGMKVAFNPGSRELQYPDKIRGLLDDVTLLVMNKEEMQLIVEGDTMEELARHAAHYVDYAVVTDGPQGVTAVGKGKVVTGGMYKDVKVVDRTGAGDAFGSGFAAMVAKGETLEKAVVFASANSTSVVTKIGATAGILHARAHLEDMPLKVKRL